MQLAFGLVTFLAGCHSESAGAADAGAATPLASASSPSIDAAVAAIPSPNTEGALETDAGARVVKLPDRLSQKLASDALDGGGTPAHPFFLGPFGPAPLTVFGLAQSDPSSPFTPIAATFFVGNFQPLEIEPFTDPPRNGWKIDAVLFDAIDATKKASPIVIAELMTGIGPKGAQPFTQVIVYSWNGTKFVHAKAVEKKLAGATTADEVRKRLEPLKNGQ